MNTLHQEAITKINRRTSLSEFEKGFVGNLSRKPQSYELTPKQAKVLEGMARRMGVIQ